MSNVNKKFQLPLRKRCTSIVKLIAFIYSKNVTEVIKNVPQTGTITKILQIFCINHNVNALNAYFYFKNKNSHMQANMLPNDTSSISEV